MNKSSLLHIFSSNIFFKPKPIPSSELYIEAVSINREPFFIELYITSDILLIFPISAVP